MHLLCLVLVCLTTVSILWEYVTSNGGMINEYRIGKMQKETFVLQLKILSQLAFKYWGNV